MNKHLLAICFGLMMPSFLFAQLPSPRLDRITPLGASVGSQAELEIQGADIEEPTLHFDHPGITATPIEGKDRFFRVAVGNDVPEGTYDCRVIGKYGISNPRLFAVHRGMTDVLEIEPNNEPSAAQSIRLNEALFGSSDTNELDIFKIQLEQGVRITIDCSAARLDSMLDATLSLVDSQGKQLAASSDYFGKDPLIDFEAPLAGEYWIILHDLSYRGGLPYRLMVTTRPFVEAVSPRIVQEGKPVTFTALGRNLGNSSKESTSTLNGRKLFEAPYSSTPPSDLLQLGKFTFLEHPAQHSNAPTAATCTLNGWQIRPEFDAIPSLNAVSIMTTDLPVIEEVENNDRNHPQPIALPVALNGHFDSPRDADWFEFTIAEEGSYSLDLYCERIAGQADPYAVIMDDKGNRVLELDDFGHRINAFDGHLRDPSGSVNLSKGKTYKLLIQDRYQRGGPRYQYALVLRRSQADFFIATIHSQNPGPAGTTILRGGATYFDVIIHQTGGYNGPIVLSAENLPVGVHSSPTTLGLGSSGTFVLWADRDAAITIAPIRLLATGERDGVKFTREVRPYSRVWNQGDGTSQPMRECWVAVRDSAPFGLRFQEPQASVVAGQKVDVKLKLDRHWESFKEPLNILPISWPGNFKIQSAQFTLGADELTLAVEVQAGTRPGEYTLAVLGQGQVPFTKKADGSDLKNTLVSLPSQPFTLLVKKPEQ